MKDGEDPLRWECGERVPGRGVLVNKRQEVARSGYVKVGGDLFHGRPEQGLRGDRLTRRAEVQTCVKSLWVP